MIDLTISKKQLQRTVKRAQERGIIIPTFAQMKEPGLAPAKVKQGLKNVGLWDVDPLDWQTPGTGVIQGRILGAAKSGSIILMHDAGGPRGLTVAALPAILGNLKRRGYQFVPVKDLLGYKTAYRPR